MDAAERWLHAIAVAAASADPPPAPDASIIATHPDLAEAWTLLFG